MGEGTTRVVGANGSGTRVRELDEEITQARGRLDALVVELDRRRHRVTDVRRLVRRHARTMAAVGVLIVAALAVAPVVLARTRRRQGTWSRKAAGLGDKASRLGHALGRVAHNPDRLAPPPQPSIFGAKTLFAIGLSLAQIILPRLLAPRADRRPATRPGLGA
jgi:hypothetical protein